MRRIKKVTERENCCQGWANYHTFQDYLLLWPNLMQNTNLAIVLRTMTFDTTTVQKFKMAKEKKTMNIKLFSSVYVMNVAQRTQSSQLYKNEPTMYRTHSLPTGTSRRFLWCIAGECPGYNFFVQKFKIVSQSDNVLHPI